MLAEANVPNRNIARALTNRLWHNSRIKCSNKCKNLSDARYQHMYFSMPRGRYFRSNHSSVKDHSFSSRLSSMATSFWHKLCSNKTHFIYMTSIM